MTGDYVTLYVAGPMTGLPEFNYPAFHAAAAKLRAAGYLVLNPAETNIPEGSPWSVFMREGLRSVTRADGVARLPGWRKSRGASLEMYVAERIGLDVRPLRGWLA